MKRLGLVLALSLLAVSAVSAVVLSGVATGSGQLLPDMRMAKLQRFTIDTTTIPGHKLLRYTTIAVNLGAGKMELRGQRPNTSTPLMTVSQRIYNAGGGGFTDVPTPTDMHWAGADGHNHWHSTGFVGSELERFDNGSKVASTKTDFCLEDSYAFNPGFPGAPSAKVYKGCVQGGQTSLSLTMGISPGWGDRYAYSLPLQWIDITDLPPGAYRLWVTVDPNGWFTELDETNNVTWTDLELTENSVKVIAEGPNAGSDTTPPVFQSAAVNGSALTMSYNDVLNPGSTPPNGSFVISGGHTITGANVAGSTVTLTLSPAAVNGETITLGYTPGTSPIEDVAGNNAAALNNEPITNNTPPADITPPVFQSAAVNGSALTMSYNEVLNPGSTPPNGSFVISGGHTITGANVAGSTVTLTLSPAAVNGETITLGYIPGTPPIEDVAGNNAAALSAAPVTNSTPSPTFTFLPNGDGPHDAVIKDQDGGTTNLYTAIDDTIAGADNGTTYVRNNTSKSGSYLIQLTSTPESFSQMKTLTIDVRARTTGAVDDQTTLFAQVFQADGVTPLTGEIAVATNPGASSFTTISGVSFTGLTGGSKAIWDGAQLRLRWAYMPVGTQETTQLRVTAVEVDGTF